MPFAGQWQPQIALITFAARSEVMTSCPYSQENAAITAEYKFTNQIRDPNGIDQLWIRSYSSSLADGSPPDPTGLAAVDPTNPHGRKHQASEAAVPGAVTWT